jgi:hypothetical protein
VKFRIKLINENLLKIVLAEVTIFVIFLIIAGYYLHSEDILFLKTVNSPLLIAVIVFSLYYGLHVGIGLIFLISLLAYFFYPKLPVKSLLWYFILVLTCGEFRFYWERKIEEAEAIKSYYGEQIDSLRKHLYLLKLSHDQLENSYIIKPYSIRRVIEELKKNLLEGKTSEEELINFFLLLISQNFQVNRAAIYEIGETRKLINTYKLGNASDFSLDDPLLKRALEEGNNFYYTPKDSNEPVTNSLAVFVERLNNKRLLLSIQDIDFSYFTEEILNYIYVLFSYLVEDISFAREFKKEKVHLCSFEFMKEYKKMFKLYEKFETQSSLVLVKILKEPFEEVYEEIKNSLRYLDVPCHIKSNYALILLPLTDISGARAFSQRITGKLKDKIEVKEIILLNRSLSEMHSKIFNILGDGNGTQ